MEPCKLNHWENLSLDYDWKGSYELLGFSDWLCPM